MSGAAERLGRLLDGHFGGRLPVRLRAWDGSEAGPAGAPVVVVRSRRALRRLLWQPSGLGLAEAYIAPDMHMRPVGRTVDLLEGAGLEVRSVEAMREHYAATIAAWYRTLDGHPETFTALAGEQAVRLWRLYLAGSMLAFAEGRMGVDQILAVRPDPAGACRPPATAHGWYAPVRP